MKKMMVSMMLGVAFFSAVQAQDRLSSPAQGTPERKAILDGVRGVVEQKLKGCVFQ